MIKAIISSSSYETNLQTQANELNYNDDILIKNDQFDLDLQVRK